MHVRTCKNTDIHLPFVRADRSASRRRCRHDASSIFERNHFQNSGSLQTRQQLESAQARCPLQLSGFGHNIHRPKACETNLDDGVEAPNVAHSDQSQGPFWGVYRSARRMEACHLRRADWHLWVSFPRETQRYHVYPVEPPLLVACHKPQIGGRVFLNPATSRTIPHASLGARPHERIVGSQLD